VLSRWPIRNKLIVGLVLLLVIVAIASGAGLYGLYAYRAMVKSISARAYELPLSASLMRHASNLRLVLCRIHVQPATASPQADVGAASIENEVARILRDIGKILAPYSWQLDYNEFEVEQFNAGTHERRAFDEFRRTFDHLKSLSAEAGWATNQDRVNQMTQRAARLEQLACDLPAYLHKRMKQLASDVRTQYRSLIWLSWITLVLGSLLLLLLVKLFYDWVFRPLAILIKGSRRVAAGMFNYRIELASKDEMGELANAMNDMTARFQAIRDDLDRQVKERTKQVVRSEQLASVGFLAAGVAHEINNPLASIAMCAESLESRLANFSAEQSSDQAVIRQYLKMIQSEAFRCKEITERLLDFSRMGDVQRQPTELRALVQGVVDMVRHVGKYHDKQVEFEPGPYLAALVNPQEMKQVVLNLLTNALDSIEAGGTVRISLSLQSDQVVLAVADNGCGMTPEVLEHLFEPFFTRKRGGQGTGLGLSISYRIIADHGGQIEAHSAGPGKGSEFRVVLPTLKASQETRHRNQAA
jgi:signal transduction histidine kinase